MDRLHWFSVAARAAQKPDFQRGTTLVGIGKKCHSFILSRACDFGYFSPMFFFHCRTSRRTTRRHSGSEWMGQIAGSRRRKQQFPLRPLLRLLALRSPLLRLHRWANLSAPHSATIPSIFASFGTYPARPKMRRPARGGKYGENIFDSFHLIFFKYLFSRAFIGK